MRSMTRRQFILSEHTKEQIRFIVLAVALLALLVTLGVSCARCSGCSNGEQAQVSETDTPEDGALVLSGDDVSFLASVTEYPRLVSTASPLPNGYAPPELITLYGMPDGDENRLNYDAANAFYALRDGMIADGMAIIPLSGYRTYDEQVSIFNYNVSIHTAEGMSPEEARAYTERFVAYPGTSEHQYGRSIDVTIDGTTNHTFNQTEQGQWLIDHAHEYGFVIRYPDDKADITGINYEPWHLRWVGVAHATFMHRHSLCLEEYIDLVLRHNPMAVMAQ